MAVRFLQWDTVKAIDVIGMAEHHETFNKISNSKICKTLEAVGRRCFGTSARPTGNSIHGNSGGVLIAPLRHLDMLPLSYPQDNTIHFAEDDMVGFTMRLRGVDVLLVQVYFETGTGLGPNNTRKLKKLAHIAKCNRLLFIAFGDFNMPPERIAESSFLELTKAQIILAEDGEKTCNAGRGQVLDYIIASTPLCA